MYLHVRACENTCMYVSVCNISLPAIGCVPPVFQDVKSMIVRLWSNRKRQNEIMLKINSYVNVTPR